MATTRQCKFLLVPCRPQHLKNSTNVSAARCPRVQAAVAPLTSRYVPPFCPTPVPQCLLMAEAAWRENRQIYSSLVHAAQTRGAPSRAAHNGCAGPWNRHLHAF